MGCALLLLKRHAAYWELTSLDLNEQLKHHGVGLKQLGLIRYVHNRLLFLETLLCLLYEVKVFHLSLSIVLRCSLVICVENIQELASLSRNDCENREIMEKELFMHLELKDFISPILGFFWDYFTALLGRSTVWLLWYNHEVHIEGRFGHQVWIVMKSTQLVVERTHLSSWQGLVKDTLPYSAIATVFLIVFDMPQVFEQLGLPSL